MRYVTMMFAMLRRATSLRLPARVDIMRNIDTNRSHAPRFRDGTPPPAAAPFAVYFLRASYIGAIRQNGYAADYFISAIFPRRLLDDTLRAIALYAI